MNTSERDIRDPMKFLERVVIHERGRLGILASYMSQLQQQWFLHHIKLAWVDTTIILCLQEWEEMMKKL